MPTPKLRSKIGRSRPLSARTTSTQLYTQDEILFEDLRKRTQSTPSEFLRQIVHQWAKKQRLSGRQSDENEIAVRKAHENILAEQIAPLKETTALILQKLNAFASSPLSQNCNASDQPCQPLTETNSQTSPEIERLLNQLLAETQSAARQFSNVVATINTASLKQTEHLTLNDILLERVAAQTAAHYMLSGQSYSVTWAALDFLQQYLANPLLKTNLDATDNPNSAAITHRDLAMQEGLKMVTQMSEFFGYPDAIDMPIVVPEESEQTPQP